MVPFIVWTSRDFWSLYAPRYKDETHVIFSTTNQPCTPQASGRCKIGIDRSSCITTSVTGARVTDFAGIIYGPAGVNVWHQSSQANGVTWDNCALRIMDTKARPVSSPPLRRCNSTERSRFVEYGILARGYRGQGYNSMYESHLNGWMQFQWLGAEDAELDLFVPNHSRAHFGRPMPRKPCGPQKVPQCSPMKMKSLGCTNGAGTVCQDQHNFSELTADLLVYTGGAASGGFFFERRGPVRKTSCARQCLRGSGRRHQSDGGDGRS